MQKTRLLQFARQLRHNQTLAETKLWGCLRKRSLGGYRFNRQVSVGPYFVDFLCREKALVIEVDGATHGELSEIKHDARRTAFLAAQGLEVCRINNEDIYKNLSGVLDGLLQRLQAQPSRFKQKPPSALRAPPPAS